MCSMPGPPDSDIPSLLAALPIFLVLLRPVPDAPVVTRRDGIDARPARLRDRLVDGVMMGGGGDRAEDVPQDGAALDGGALAVLRGVGRDADEVEDRRQRRSDQIVEVAEGLRLLNAPLVFADAV